MPHKTRGTVQGAGTPSSSSKGRDLSSFLISDLGLNVALSESVSWFREAPFRDLEGYIMVIINK